MKMKKADQGQESRVFTFFDGDNKPQRVSIDNDSIYMIDVDLPKYIPMLDKMYASCFKMPEILPGGEMCMMNVVRI